MNIRRIEASVKALAISLTAREQIKVAEIILESHNSLKLTLTKEDATKRIMELYQVGTVNEAESISERFFSSQKWETEREQATDQYWENACGAEVLFSPLDDWMLEQGLKKNR